MLWCLLVALSPIASAFVPQLGLNPVIGNGLYGVGGGLPYYPGGYLAKPLVYGQQMVDGSNYYGGGQGYKNYIADDASREALRDANVMVNKGAQGHVGRHAVAKGNEGNQGYYSDAIGAKYNTRGNGAAGAAKKYGYSGDEGYGGFGNAGHRKGHKTSGFHKTYHNIESGKDTKYVDEDHDLGEQKFGQAYDSAYDDKAWDARDHGHGEGLYAEKVAEDTAARGAMKAGGAHDIGYDAHNHNGYYNDRDAAYRAGQAMTMKGGAGRMGINGMNGMSAGQLYHGPGW